ncbi:Recombinase NinB, partial [uncultured Caudovirales phage]
MIYKLENSKQAHTLILTLWEKIKTALDAGKCLTLEIKAESKTRDQEEKYHAMIGEIAKQAQHQGARW